MLTFCETHSELTGHRLTTHGAVFLITIPMLQPSLDDSLSNGSLGEIEVRYVCEVVKLYGGVREAGACEWDSARLVVLGAAGGHYTKTNLSILGVEG